MFRMFKKRDKCRHNYVTLAKLYEDNRAQYKNHPNVVCAYVIYVCDKCEGQMVKDMPTKRYPLWWQDGNDLRRRHIEKLKSRGFSCREDYIFEKFGTAKEDE